jgi:hypothetical protein
MGQTAQLPAATGTGTAHPGIKTRLIRAAGGYGGFQAKYGRNPFHTTNEQAKGLVGRNEKCFCGSTKKFKKCCLNK